MRPSRIILTLIFTIITLVSSITYAQDTRQYTIGYFLYFGNNAFKTQMAELGYLEGVNTTYLTPVVEGFETMPFEEVMANLQAQTQTIIDAAPDVIITNTDTDAVNMRPIAGNIPIVFARSDDPVATGAVQDLINPGGHVTGIITNRPHERRLQIMTEILPTTDAVYYLYSPLTGEGETVLQQVRAVGEELGVEVIAAPIIDLQSGLDALANAPEGIDWLFLTPYVPFDFQFIDALNALSLERKIGIAGVTDLPTPGYLMGYGPNIDDSDAQAARIADRILRGASPADLPVETAENFLMINLEQAVAIEMEIPEGILRQTNTIVRPGYFDNMPAFGTIGS